MILRCLARTRRTRPARAVARAALVGLLLASAAGCAHRPPKPVPTPPAKPGPPAGYLGRIDSLEVVDGSRLAGRRIAIDPGHGGFFRGSMGVNGLAEADVNLGVALRLRDLLAARGALVFMTRDRDRDFLTPADSTLRFDLNERSRLANEFAPDLFISIHHNADAGGAHDVNETQTYYKLSDEGPSFELGADVHRAIARNVGIGAGRLLPGNFAVLRNASAPAILTESSYLTYPPTESLLVRSDKQQIEAEALYLGLARYAMRTPPVIEALELRSQGFLKPDSASVSSFPTLTGRVRGAFDQVTFTVDGAPVRFVRDAGRIEWTPREALEPGPHQAALQVRLAGEGASAQSTCRFTVRNAPDRIQLEFPNQAGWDGRQPLGLRVRVLDQEGRFSLDTLSVRVRSRGGIALTPADTVIALRDGVGWGYFRYGSRNKKVRAPSVEIDGVLKPNPMTEAGPLVPKARGAVAWTRGLKGVTPSHRTGFARDVRRDSALTAAPGTAGATPAIEWINRDGFVMLPVDSAGAVSVPQLAGYRAAVSDSAWPPHLAPIADGALLGRRITLDPAGGGEEPAGLSASGTRGAELNLEVARALRGLLVAAGADVAMTRDGNIAVSDIQRVQISEAFRSDRYLRIGHGGHPPRAGYYFSSAAGKRWAQRVTRSVAAFGLPSMVYGEDAQWPIQQTSCVALYASPGRITDPVDEDRLRAPGTLRAEAWALFAALIGEFADSAAMRVDTIDVRDASGAPVAGAAVVLGGALVTESDASGQARFARTERGSIEIACEDPRVRARAVLIESARRFLLTGTPGR